MKNKAKLDQSFVSSNTLCYGTGGRKMLFKVTKNILNIENVNISIW